MLKSLHGLSMLWNILKFVHKLQLKMYEKSPSKSMKTTILRNAPRAPALWRQAFMFAFNLKSIFWGTMLWRAKVYNGTKVLSLLFPVSPYVKFSGTTYVWINYLIGCAGRTLQGCSLVQVMGQWACTKIFITRATHWCFIVTYWGVLYLA